MNFRARGINALWATLLVDELTRCGVRDFVISPGSRSTPLTLAVAHNKRARSRVHYDERGAAFYALGLTRATERPTALICTSGTAGANYYPAIVEAYMSRLPLIVLTADRPPELQNCGANQTIDQRNLYGNHAKKFVNLDCPSLETDPAVLLKSIDSIMQKGLSSPAGPVHLNCMFREPLAPTEDEVDYSDHLSPLREWSDTRESFSSIQPTSLAPDNSEVNRAVSAIDKKPGLLILGRLHTEKSRSAALRLARHLQWPTIVDLLSGLRGALDDVPVLPYHNLDIKSVESILNTSTPVLYLGEQIISKRVQLLFERIRPEVFVRVVEYPYATDPGQLATRQIVGDIELVCDELIRGINSTSPITTFSERAKKIDKLLEKELSDGLSEPAVTRLIGNIIGEESNLFVGNSLPIRECDSFFAFDKDLPAVGCNRGASGIDGTIASAAGFASGHMRPLTLILGDLTFLHDLSSLALLKNAPPITIIVFNNDGGGIFSFLPISERSEHFEKFFGTPHGLSFEHAAAMFSIVYHCPQSLSQFENTYKTAVAGVRPSVIEIKTNRTTNHELHQQLLSKIAELR